VLRLTLAILLGGLLFTLFTVLHLASIAYLAGVLSGLLVGMVLWLRVRRRNSPNRHGAPPRNA
jgi:high-affinity Fe2+/Pb2+ permease